jgi:hypothetical protein
MNKNFQLNHLKSKWVFILGFALIGSVLLSISFGAQPFNTIEPENGVYTSRISVIDDATASGGKAVQFRELADGNTSVKAYPYYYLWWSETHWHDKLGTNYPYDQSPLPLPATLDADGCNAQTPYAGNQLIDVPAALYTQDTPGVIEGHVRQAAAKGIPGFLVNWNGTGLAGQTADSVSYSRRLREMVRAVNEVNAEGIPFKLMLSYKTDSPLYTAVQINNDWNYIYNEYGTNPAFEHTFSDRFVVFWTGSWKYDSDISDPVTIRTVSQAQRSRFFILGDEKPSASTALSTWSRVKGFMDGTTYYWSTQNPYSNASSFNKLQSFADEIRASGSNPDGSKKLWIAPFTPGYNSVLLGGTTCVPRSSGGKETMRELYNGNKLSNPDGWAFISWNELAEGSFIEPQQRWGSKYLDLLGEIVNGR